MSLPLSGQTEQDINKTDNSGKKQGRWVKKYPNGTIMYEGFFRNDNPDGELKRYYEDSTLKSVLNFSGEGRTANAVLYYPNGFMASRGRYENQLKEGKWQFFSVLTKGLMISEEEYLNNKKSGLSVIYYADSVIAERSYYRNDLKNGEWISYHPNGKISFKTHVVNGRIDGEFEAFFNDGKPEIKGRYKSNLRDGQWTIFSHSGTVRFKIEYFAGKALDNALDIYESNYIDSMEINRVKIDDPEKTGIIWQ